MYLVVEVMEGPTHVGTGTFLSFEADEYMAHE